MDWQATADAYMLFFYSQCTPGAEYNFQFVCGTTAYEVNAKLILDGSRLLGQLDPKQKRWVNTFQVGGQVCW